MDKTVTISRTSAREDALNNVVRFDDVRFYWDAVHEFNVYIKSFEVKRGEKLLLVGPSGSGKSTLLSLLTGIVSPQSGKVSVLNEDLGALSNRERDRFRAEHFGIIFQMFNLLPYGSVLDNVILPLNFAKERRARVLAELARGGTLEDEARRLLSRLGLSQDIQNRKSTAALSVGQQQRVAAARALIGRPEIIVADEPTSALDRNRQSIFLKLLFEEVGALGSTLIMVSHDESLGTSFDRILHLNDVMPVPKASGNGVRGGGQA